MKRISSILPTAYCPLLVAYCLLLLLSCSPQARLNRLVRKYPELVRTDTVWRKDTVVFYGTKTDTIIKIWQKDTVIIKKDQLTLKYYMRNDSTIYLEGECDTVTIYRNVPVVVNSLTATPGRGWFVDFLLNNFLVLCLIIVLSIYIFRKKRIHDGKDH